MRCFGGINSESSSFTHPTEGSCGEDARRRISLSAFQHVQHLHAVFGTHRGSGHSRVLHPVPGSRPWHTQRVGPARTAKSSSVRVLRSPRSVALCDFPRQRLIAANEPLVGRQPHVSDRAERRDSPARSRCALRKRVFRPVPGTLEIILFGAEAGPSLTYSASTHPASVLNTTQVCSGVAQNTDGVALRPLCLFASACRPIPGILD